jgi:hypothetical protein
MRRALVSLVVSVLSTGLLACDGADAGSDGPTCGGGFAEEVAHRYGYEPGGECVDVLYFSGVEVRLPSVSPDTDWLLSGTVGNEPFRCIVAAGMLEGEPCSDNPKVRWFPGESAPGVELRAHPCQVSLQLKVGGEVVAAGTFEPEYEWSEPNGDGCGWTGEATVILAPDED